MSSLLEIEGLSVEFRMTDGVIRAVNDVSFDVRRGEVVAVVGESGSGKSMTALAVLQLVPQPPGRITAGAVRFDGQDLLRLDENGIRAFRGRRIGMVFQEPMTSLNPCCRSGGRSRRPCRPPGAPARRRARARARSCCRPSASPSPSAGCSNIPITSAAACASA
jgi:oligopeptide transport system ATP-binding protein